MCLSTIEQTSTLLFYVGIPIERNIIKNGKKYHAHIRYKDIISYLILVILIRYILRKFQRYRH